MSRGGGGRISSGRSPFGGARSPRPRSGWRPYRRRGYDNGGYGYGSGYGYGYSRWRRPRTYVSTGFSIVLLIVVVVIVFL